MKTKDLIAALQDADPSGEEQVSVGNQDIWYVNREPAYWDGCLQVFKRDPSKDGCTIVGAEIRSQGVKIVINSASIDDLMLDFPDLPVTFDGEYAREHYVERVEQWRKENRKIIESVKSQSRE